MPNIYFTQYLRPSGRPAVVSIWRGDDIAAKADSIMRQGFRFETEVLMTGQVSFTISDDDDDYAIEVCDNGTNVPLTVDKLILDFNLADAIKKRATR